MTMSRAMPESIDWPRTPRPRRRGRRFFFILAAVVAVVLACRTALSYYVEALWVGSLGYRDVFWKTQGVQWVIFAAFAATTFLILYGSFLALKRAHSTELRSGQTICIAGQAVRLPVEPVFEDHVLFGGVTFTVEPVYVPGMVGVCVGLVLGAVVATVNAVTVQRVSWLVAAMVPAAACYLIVQVYGSYVNSFIVKPNQL